MGATHIVQRKIKKPLDTVVHVRIDGETKRKAEIVLDAMGLTIASAARLLLLRVAEDRRLPFSPLIPNEETLRVLAEIDDGKYAEAKSYSDAESLLRDIEEHA